MHSSAPKLPIAAAISAAFFGAFPERAAAQDTAAFTLCQSDADCAGERCISAGEKICEEQKKALGDACPSLSGDSCQFGAAVNRVQTAFRDIHLPNYFDPKVCVRENNACVLKESVFDSDHCPDLKEKISGSDYRDKKYCSSFGLQPAAAAAPAQEGLSVPKVEFRPPILSVPIPGIPSFSDVKLEGPEGQRYYLIPWLAQYLEAIYRYALSIIGVIATVMVVYGGIKWLTAGGAPEKISAAKKTITEAVMGLVLALGSYLILFTINPEIVKFRALQVAFIEQAQLPAAIADIGDGEGEPGAGAGGCAHYAQDIRSQRVQCQAGPAMPSPTGRPWNCNYHTETTRHVTGFGSKPLLEVISLDFLASYGTVISAPVAGTVRLKPGKREDCRGSTNGKFAATCPGGNRVELQFGNGYQYNMAHVSEFLVSDGTRVEAGQPIAKVGGQCCRELNGERFDTPEWKTKTSWTGHFWNDGCKYSAPNCRPPWETGNAPGPHVHASITKGEQPKIPILPCIQ